MLENACLGEPWLGVVTCLKAQHFLVQNGQKLSRVGTVILQALFSSWEYGGFLGLFSLDLLHRLAFQVDEVPGYR